ncbi:hypothetical protein IGJ55_002073 [Enterococcus sp. AZ170]
MQTKTATLEEDKDIRIFQRDKNKSDLYVFVFEIVWFMVTCSISLYKFDKLYNSSKDYTDVAYFVLIFALPILIKHVLRLHFYQTLSEFTNKYIIVFYWIANVIFIASGAYFLLIMLLLSNHDFKIDLFVYVITLCFHIVVIILGLYDKLMVKMKPNLEGGN